MTEMNKKDAQQIAEIITFEQLAAMFTTAKDHTKNWREVSSVNKNMTKGTSWNILFPALKPDIMLQKLALTNMIREFGDHLAHDLKLRHYAKAIPVINICHQEPKF
jgi:hypothetical protein